MYDKTVRRRRAVLGLLVASSLILLTAYFGESNGGGLHAIQRGVLTVVSPIQDVASRALSPVRNLVNWTSDTLHAKGQLKKIRADDNKMHSQLASAQLQLHRLRAQTGINEIVTNDGLKGASPIRANLVTISPNLVNASLTIDVGTGDGVRTNMTVLGGDDHYAGMIGVISDAWANGSRVTLLTDQTSSVMAEDTARGVRGDLGPLIGDPNHLELLNSPANTPYKKGDLISTAGTCSVRNLLRSHSPEGIPLGRVTDVRNPGPNQHVIVTPYVDVRRLSAVTVLRKVLDHNRSISPTCPS